ncbi:pilus assembly protein PilM [Gracilibacillus sp. YIM 98692]|uniref:type IV pilus biogenesis protein PilM n=1 Tax=Gracilibacillus sp. YIM 98692 TaxID=2663532 RepID=UPI0013D82F4F|nr:pilus assembly protein PilM [Gracilibacillus sp. YIM 98692]
MLLRKKKHVHIIWFDNYFKYMVSRGPNLAQIIDTGVVPLDDKAIEDGKMVNQGSVHHKLKKVSRRKKWGRAKVSFSVPNAFVTIRKHSFPRVLSAKEVKQHIQIDDEMLRLPFKNPLLDVAFSKDEDEKKEWLVYAYPSHILHDYMEILKNVKLKPRIADISSLAVMRTYQHFQAEVEQQNLLIIQWNQESLFLSVFENSQLIFSRHVKSPVDSRQSWRWDIEKETLDWDLSDEEQQRIINQHFLTIERFIDFYLYSVKDGKEGIEKMIVTGDVPFIDKIANQMKSHLDMSIHALGESISPPYKDKHTDLLGLVLRGDST